jgi:hypothetical protein
MIDKQIFEHPTHRTPRRRHQEWPPTPAPQKSHRVAPPSHAIEYAHRNQRPNAGPATILRKKAASIVDLLLLSVHRTHKGIGIATFGDRLNRHPQRINVHLLLQNRGYIIPKISLGHSLSHFYG